VTQALLAAAALVFSSFAVYAARRSSYHRGKSDAFQQVADDFTGLSRATWFRDRDRQKQERKKAMLRLALCDPRVCEALSEALTEARAHWHHPSAPAYDELEKPSGRVGTPPKEAA
jgi:hypothetical protein